MFTCQESSDDLFDLLSLERHGMFDLNLRILDTNEKKYII